MPAYSPRALSWATALVRAYTDSVDGDVTAEVEAILGEVGEDEAELRNLVALLAGLAGHAVMVITAHLQADPQLDDDPEALLALISEHRDKVLGECVEALREFRPASLRLPPATRPAESDSTTERRSGLERRVGSDRRRLAPGNPSEKINLRLFGERRLRIADRRSGTDRRRDGGEPSG